MKRGLPFIRGLCLISCLVACQEKEVATSLPETSPPPKSLIFTPESVTIEAKLADQEIFSEFRIRNEGPSSVTIHKIKSSCACLDLQVDSRTLKPGEETKISAIFTVRKMDGVAHQSIYLYTEDTERPSYAIPVTIQVPAVYEVSPSSLKWTVGDHPTTRKVRIKIVAAQSIEALSAKDRQPGQLTTSITEIEKGREYEISMTPRTTDEQAMGIVEIKTDFEYPAHSRVLVFYSISPP